MNKIVTLKDQFKMTVGSAQPLIIVKTNEADEAIRDMTQVCENQDHKWGLWLFKPNTGLEINGEQKPNTNQAPPISGPSSGPTLPKTSAKVMGGENGAMAAIEAFIGFDNSYKKTPGEHVTTVLVMCNVQRYLQEPRLIQWLMDVIRVGKTQNKSVVLVTHKGVKIPPELDPVISTIIHKDPTMDEHNAILDEVKSGSDDLDIPKATRVRILEAGRGLSRLQFENAIAQQVVRGEDIDPKEMWEYKVELFNQDGLLEIYRPTAGLEMLGGMSFYKEDMTKLIKKGRAPKMLNAGPPGCLHPDTPIYDPVDGTTMTVKARFDIGEAFNVLSLDEDGNVVNAVAESPWAYTSEPMLKFTLTDGRSITVTHGHRFWNGVSYEKAYEVASRLLECGVVRLPSISESDHEVLRRDARRSIRKAEGSLEGCSSDCRLCGGQLLDESGACRSSLPSPVGVRQHSRSSWREDDRDDKGTHNPYSSSCRHSMTDSSLRFGHSTANERHARSRQDAVERVDDWSSVASQYQQPTSRDRADAATRQCAPAASVTTNHENVRTNRHVPTTTDTLSLHSHRTRHRSDSVTCLVGTGEGIYPRRHPAVSACPSRGSEVVWSDVKCNHHVEMIKVEDVGNHVYYDFHVPKYENYFACGVFNHNTGKTAGAFALGHDTKLNVLIGNLGKLFQKYVGESEERARAMMEMVERNAPCIFVLDELPRYISTDSGDGGSKGSDVNAKVGAEWLTWLSSAKAKDIVIVATANEWSGVDTLVRSERFDFCVYTSIAMSKQKSTAVWDIHRKDFAIEDKELPEHSYWTGAEIRSCCKKASSQWFDEPLTVSATRTTNVIETMRRSIMSMERKGRGVCLDVETGRKFLHKSLRQEEEAQKTSGAPAQQLGTKNRRSVKTLPTAPKK